MTFHGDQPAELNIRRPGWRFYGETFLLWLLGIAVAAYYWGAEVLVLVDGPDHTVGVIHRRVGFVSQLWAIIAGGAGVLVALGMPVFVAVSMIDSWRGWRTLRRPEIFIDAEGIRFEAARRSLRISWREIERLELCRSVYKYRRRRSIFNAKLTMGVRTVSILRVRVLPDFPELNTGFRRIPGGGWLVLGRMEKDVDIPYEEVIEFLRRVAGPLFEIRERAKRIRRTS